MFIVFVINVHNVWGMHQGHVRPVHNKQHFLCSPNTSLKLNCIVRWLVVLQCIWIALSSRSNSFYFHAVFGIFFQNNRLAHLGLAHPRQILDPPLVVNTLVRSLFRLTEWTDQRPPCLELKISSIRPMNKIAFQQDAYRPLVDRIPTCTAQGGCLPGRGCLPRGMPTRGVPARGDGCQNHRHV